jgi:hypothetical protein
MQCAAAGAACSYVLSRSDPPATLGMCLLEPRQPSRSHRLCEAPGAVPQLVARLQALGQVEGVRPVPRQRLQFAPQLGAQSGVRACGAAGGTGGVRACGAAGGAGGAGRFQGF